MCIVIQICVYCKFFACFDRFFLFLGCQSDNPAKFGTPGAKTPPVSSCFALHLDMISLKFAFVQSFGLFQ